MNDPASEPNPHRPTRNPWEGEFITRSPQETFELAKRIGESLEGGNVFLLRGDLGAGKTVFAKGLAAGLAIDPADVTSPSFTLINAHEARLRFYHVDLYRLDAEAAQSLGLEELFEDQKSVIAIEWAERLDFVPVGATLVKIEYVSDVERTITIQMLI